MNAPFDPKSLPWMVAGERAYGALADAMGLHPLRQMAHAWLDLASAQSQELAAQTDFAGLTTVAWIDGLQRFAQQLGARPAGSDPIASPTALLRLWAVELEASMSDVMTSEKGLKATAATVRAMQQRTLQMQRLFELGSQAAGAPTRSDLDDAFREIQQLKREVRRLQRAVQDKDARPEGHDTE